MKLITAIIREVQLDKVREALIVAEITRITVCRVSGHGQQRIEEMYRGQRIVPDLIPKIKIEVIVPDSIIDQVCDIIEKTAKTGKIGDGKIFISNVDDAVRIRTGQRGEGAIS